MKYIRYIVNTPPKQVWQRARRKLAGKTAAASFTPDHPCIFVLSTGRVGSQTLAALLSLCKNTISLHEPRPALYKMSKTAYQYNGNIQDPVWCAAFQSLRADLLQSALNSGYGYIETSPQATFLAPAIAASISNVKFIHLVRHPVDVVRSGMRRGWYAGHPGDITRITPREGSMEANRWDKMTPIQKNIWLWAETNRWILDFTKTLPAEDTLLLQSEKIFAGDDATLRTLFEFCSNQMPPQQKIQRILGRQLNRQDSGVFPSFADWSPDSLDDLHLFAGDVASTLGYSLDPNAGLDN